MEYPSSFICYDMTRIWKIWNDHELENDIYMLFWGSLFGVLSS